MDEHFRSKTAANLAALLVILLFFAASAFFSRSTGSDERSYSFIETPGAAERGFRLLHAQVGEDVETFRIVVEPAAIMLVGKARGRDRIQEWRLEHRRYWRWVRERVYGPSSSVRAGAALQIGGGFFDPAEVDFRLVPDLAREAVERARLFRGGSIDAVTVERRLRGGRPSAFEDVRFVLPVFTDDESAVIHAGLDGRITGGDLSRTRRWESIDLIAEADFLMTDAQRALREEIGEGPVIHEISVRGNGITLRVANRLDPQIHDVLRWDLAGMRRSPDNFAGMGRTMAEARARSRGTRPFSLDAVDLRLIPDIVSAARKGLPEAEGNVVQLTAEQSARELSDAPVVWRVGIGSHPSNLETAFVDAGGRFLRIESKPEQVDWLDPPTIARGVAIIAEA